MTARELAWMSRGRRKADWSIASHLLAQQATIYRGKGDPPVSPAQMNPFTRVEKADVSKVDAATFVKLMARGLGAKVVPFIPGKFIRNEAWELYKANQAKAKA